MTQFYDGSVGADLLAPDNEVERLRAFKARAEKYERALKYIAEGFGNYNVSHVDYRNKVRQIALDALKDTTP